MTHADDNPFGIASLASLDAQEVPARAFENEDSRTCQMIDQGLQASIAGRQFIRRLGDSAFGRRYLCLDERRQTDCMLWLFNEVEQDRMPAVWAYLKTSVGQRRAHVLPIEAVGRERGGVCWAVTPYVGNHQGIVSLRSLREARGGAMTVFETSRAIEQLLDASVRSHAAGVVHGELSADCVLVSPRGTLEVGMYGLAGAINGPRDIEDAKATEVRSIGAIAWQLLTGLSDGPANAEADRMQSGAAMRSWIRKVCDPIDGFDSAIDAVRALPASHEDASESRLSGARSILGKLTSVVGAKSGRGNTERKKDRPSGVR